MNKTAVTISAIVCVAGLAALALFKGINGALLTSAMTAIAGLGGYTLGKRSQKPKAQPNGSASKPDNSGVAP